MIITDGYPAKPLTKRRRHNNAALMDTVFDRKEKGTAMQQTEFDSREITNLQQKKGRAKDAAE
jgi:serine/threonine protein kinase HipA of HipAB toxin-antitoxin module